LTIASRDFFIRDVLYQLFDPTTKIATNGYPLDARKVLLDGFRQGASRPATQNLAVNPAKRIFAALEVP